MCFHSFSFFAVNAHDLGSLNLLLLFQEKKYRLNFYCKDKVDFLTIVITVRSSKLRSIISEHHTAFVYYTRARMLLQMARAEVAVPCKKRTSGMRQRLTVSKLTRFSAAYLIV